MMVKASEIAFRRTIKHYSTRRNVEVATLGDRLALTITSTPLMDVDRAESDRAATAFLSSGVKHLELAVRQEVASVAA
ncbi:hypothetical protein LC609_28875 [Nostoc sp. XA013]|nr:hypothetical protein [Nostoc sp. XA013]